MQKLAARLARGQLATSAFLTRHEQHLARAPRQRTIAPAVVRCLDDEADVGTELGKPRWRIEPDAVLAFTASAGAAPMGLDREDARERIEAALLRVQGAVRSAPPIAVKEARHHTVAVAAMPDENTAGPQDTCNLREHEPIVRGIGEETEGGEQIEHGVEAPAPGWRKPAHVALVIAQRRARASLASAREKMRREIHAVDEEACLRKEMRMAPLSARDVENARAGWEPEHLEEPRYFATISLEGEERLVLAKVDVVEISRPPIRTRCVRIGAGLI